MIRSAMLVTSCPDCKTTFKVSTEMLGQANGQVRCGKCSRIFDGRSALRDIPDPLAPSAPIEQDSPESAARDEPTPRPEPAASESRNETRSPGPAADSSQPEWIAEAEPSNRRVWPWAVGTGLMALMLVAQVMHHFRSELAAVPTIGSFITGAYAQVGIDVLPNANLDQYDLLDLTAAAQPFGEEPGWLDYRDTSDKRRTGSATVPAYLRALARPLGRNCGG